MNSIYTERKALQEHIEWIREERRRLSDEYWRAIERLRELDNKLADEGVSELVDKLFIVAERQNDAVNDLANLIPSIPVEEVVKYWKELNGNSEPEDIIEKVKNEEIERQKDIDDSNRPVKRSKRQDSKIMTSEIASFLKSEGVPVNTASIKSHLEEKGYTVNNPTNVIVRAMEQNDKIERVSRGFYQYKHN